MKDKAPGIGALAECPVTREQVENFLFYEAKLLDQWRLDEWQELLTDDATYSVPANDCPEGDHRKTLFLVADDRERIRQRIIRIQSPNCHAEFPKSRTQRMISNVRIDDVNGELITVEANFICHRFRRHERVYPYVGSYRYVLRYEGGGLKIKDRRAFLASEELGSLGAVSIIL